MNKRHYYNWKQAENDRSFRSGRKQTTGFNKCNEAYENPTHCALFTKKISKEERDRRTSGKDGGR
jgi:hypothetical protein